LQINDNLVQTSAYGAFIPIGYGLYRCSGNVIWMTTPQLNSAQVTVGYSESIKGREPIYGTKQWYSSSVAIAFGEVSLDRAAGSYVISEESDTGGEKVDYTERESFVGIRRLWLSGQLYMDSRTNQDEPPSGFVYALHLGGESEAQDDTIVGYSGAENTPAYRGLLYLVVPDLDLTPFGNALPLASAEIYERLDRVDTLEEGVEGMCLGVDGDLWVCSHTMRVVQRIDVSTLTVKASIGRDDAPDGQYLGTLPAHPWRCAASPDGQYIWVAHRGASKLTRISTADNSWTIFDAYKYGMDVAIDASGNVWVPYPYEGNVRKYSSSGVLLHTVSIDDAPWTCYYESSENKVWVGGNKQAHMINPDLYSITSITTGVYFHAGFAKQPTSDDLMCAASGSDNLAILRTTGTLRRLRGSGTYPLGVSANPSDPWGT
jgi:sugar lactone lactonase YvrE